MNTRSEEITDVISDEGFDRLKVGNVLTFDYEGSRSDYKITRMNKTNRRIWARQIKTYDPSEVGIVDKKGRKHAK